MINIKLDVRSLAATIFLAASLYVLAKADQGSIFNAVMEITIVIVIAFCLYLSYRLIVIINGTLG